MTGTIVIDGRTAGGQVLRTALGISAITGKAIRVENIRGARPHGGGLKTQHLQGLRAVARLCNAELKGAELSSKSIEFIPGKLEAKKLDIGIRTAGSIGLLFQSLQLAAAFAGDSIKICVNGGSTASAWSPPVHYLQNVFLPIVERMGYKADMSINREGFYPKGGAEVEITVHPVEGLRPIRLEERGEIKNIRGLSIAGNLPRHVAGRQAEAAKKVLNNKGFDMNIETHDVHTLSAGTIIVLWAECGHSILGANAIGERGVPAEKVGQAAATELLQSIDSGAALDRYMSDQILPFMALAGGKSSVTAEEVTEHCMTNIAVTERLLGVKFRVDNDKKRIEVEGIGRVESGR
jgi:RNA 3'-terminal phosphate cyclase (GTP)